MTDMGFFSHGDCRVQDTHMFCSVVLIYAMHVCCFSGTVEYMTHICFTRLDVHMSQASVVVFFVFFYLIGTMDSETHLCFSQ